MRIRCYATPSSRAPAMVASGLVDLGRGIVADAKSGVSGAARRPPPGRIHARSRQFLRLWSLHPPPYRELLEQVGIAASNHLTPHLLPIPRGILSTIYVHSANRKPGQTLRVYEEIFAAAQWSGFMTGAAADSVLRSHLLCGHRVPIAPRRRAVVVSCLITC